MSEVRRYVTDQRPRAHIRLYRLALEIRGTVDADQGSAGTKVGSRPRRDFGRTMSRNLVHSGPSEGRLSEGIGVVVQPGYHTGLSSRRAK